MSHYVCTGGCNGVSDQPGTCQMKDCIKFSLPLTACDCSDGQHAEAYENPNRTAEEETEKQ